MYSMESDYGGGGKETVVRASWEIQHEQWYEPLVLWGSCLEKMVLCKK